MLNFHMGNLNKSYIDTELRSWTLWTQPVKSAQVDKVIRKNRMYETVVGNKTETVLEPELNVFGWATWCRYLEVEISTILQDQRSRVPDGIML